MTGDTQISIYDPLFTLIEAAEISGVPEKNLRNWTQREVIKIGEQHRTGRRLYSIADLIELKVVGELTTMVAMPPAHAAVLANYARKRALEMSARGPDGKLLYKGMKEEPRRCLVAWVDEGQHKADVITLEDFFGKHSVPHAVVVVPLDDVVLRITNRAFDILEKEGK